MINKKFFLFLLIINISYLIFSNNPIDLYKQAELHFFNEDYNKAIDVLKDALQTNPHYIDAIELISRVYYESGSFEYAFTYISKALTLAPQRSDLIIFSADIETKLKRFNIAESKYKSIIASDPLNMDAFNGLANVYFLTERKILAKDTLLSILKSDQKNVHALLKLSQYYEDIDVVKADEYYQTNLRFNSLHYDLYFQYSKFKFKQRLIRDALDMINIALEIKDSLEYKIYKAKYLLYINNPDEALAVYKDVLIKNSTDNSIYYNLSHGYNKISDINNAVSSLNKSISLRPDDEIAAFFLDSILLEKFPLSAPLRLSRSLYYNQKSLEAKRAANFDLYLFNLRKSIMLNPENADSRSELADYYKSINFPERYFKELTLIYEITKLKDIKDMIEMQGRNLIYRLGVDWQINQYNIDSERYTIPVFINYNIENYHYQVESIYAMLLENLSYGKYKYELLPFIDKEYSRSEKMSISQGKGAYFYIDLFVKEIDTMVEVDLKLHNARNSDLIHSFGTYQFGNDKMVITSATILRKIDSVIPLRAKIIKLSGSSAVISAGRKHGVKLRDGVYIIKNKTYSLEQGKTDFLIDKSDIKGTGILVKIDENISEIKYNDIDSYKDIDVGDYVVLIKK